MNIDGLPVIGRGIDLKKVPPINQKRTLAFLNHFIIETVNFLNKFAEACEVKLEDMNRRLVQVETCLSILEAKLSSIPGLEKEKQSSDPCELSAEPLPNGDTNKGNQITSVEADGAEARIKYHESVEIIEKPISVTQEKPPADPRLAKYLKMLQVGIPLPAVRQKMAMENIDPSLLQVAAQEEAEASAAPTEPEVLGPRSQSSSSSEASSFSSTSDE